MKRISSKELVINFVLENPWSTNKEIGAKFGLSSCEIKDIFREIESSNFMNRVNEIEPYAILYISNLLKIMKDKNLINHIINRTPLIPKILELHLGRDCQLKCIFCQTDNNIKYNKYNSDHQCIPSISSNELLNIIDEFILSGGEEIILSGGLEPFTSKLTIPAIKYCAGKNLNISIYTNGISKTFKKDEDLGDILRNVQKIRFSINAINPETYCKIQAPHKSLSVGKRLFDQAISAVLKAQSIKLREKLPNVQIGVSFLLLRDNIGELIPAMNFWEKAGIDYFDIRSDIFNYDEIESSHNLEFIKMLLHNYAEKNPNSNMLVSWGRRYPSIYAYDVKACYAPYKKIVLDWQGEFHACCLRAHIKNDKKTSLGYYRNRGDYTEIIRKNINKIPIVPTCEKCCDQELIFNSCIQKIISDINDGYNIEDTPFRECNIFAPYKKVDLW